MCPPVYISRRHCDWLPRLRSRNKNCKCTKYERRLSSDWISVFTIRWLQRRVLSSTGCRTSHLFWALTSTVESWWWPTRLTWPGTGRHASTRPLLTRASSAGWPRCTPAPIRLILFPLSLPALISKTSPGNTTNMFLYLIHNQVMSNPDRRPCHNKDFIRYNNIINGADWHNVPGSKNVCVFLSKLVWLKAEVWSYPLSLKWDIHHNRRLNTTPADSIKEEKWN